MSDLNNNVLENEYGTFIEVVETKTTKVARDYKPTKESIAMIEKYGTKSNAIRSLKKDGKTTSEIADIMNIRYQHVRNVLNQIVKKTVTA